MSFVVYKSPNFNIFFCSRKLAQERADAEIIANIEKVEKFRLMRTLANILHCLPQL